MQFYALKNAKICILKLIFLELARRDPQRCLISDRVNTRISEKKYAFAWKDSPQLHHARVLSKSCNCIYIISNSYSVKRHRKLLNFHDSLFLSTISSSIISFYSEFQEIPSFSIIILVSYLQKLYPAIRSCVHWNFISNVTVIQSKRFIHVVLINIRLQINSNPRGIFLSDLPPFSLRTKIIRTRTFNRRRHR